METVARLQLYWDILLCYWNTDLDKNISYAKEAISLASKDDDNAVWSAKFNRALGISYYFKGEYDASVLALEQAIEYAVKSGNKREENAAYVQMGNAYMVAGENELALKYYTDALPKLEALEQYEDYANTLSNIAIIHNRFQNNKRAMEYNQLALATAQKHGLTRTQMFLYSSIGDLYHSEGKPDSALMSIHKAYEISLDLKDKPQIITCTQMLAGMYSDQGEYDKAMQYAEICLTTANEFGSKQKIVVAWIIMAKVNFDLKRYSESEKYAYQAWEADSTDFEQAENAAMYVCCSNIFLGNGEKAMLFLRKYKSIRDKFSDKSLHDSLADMEVRYETEKKEIRIEALERERRLYVMLGIAGLLLAVAVGVALMQIIRNAKREKQLIATRSVLDGEMGERSRLARDLHDRLSGNLSAVKIGLDANKESLRGVHDKLDGCIEEIRRVAHNLMPVSLQFGLKTALEDFAAQFPSVRFHFFGEEQEIDRRKAFVAYCCAAELVNNSLRHAKAKTINLQLIEDGKHISLTVQDDGIGFDLKTVSGGIGLKNIRDRVTSCNGSIDIVTSPGNGCETTIELKSGE
jgi:signal transduction histidine kinase/Tfp pilus assembly protein PilF